MQPALFFAGCRQHSPIFLYMLISFNDKHFITHDVSLGKTYSAKSIGSDVRLL